MLGPTPSISPEDTSTVAETRRAALVELRKWYDDWSTVARKYLTKRSHLIRLGLAARRRKPKAGGDDGQQGE